MLDIRRRLPHPSWFIVFLAVSIIVATALRQVLGWSSAQQSAKLLAGLVETEVVISGTIMKDAGETASGVSYTLTDLHFEKPAELELAGQLYITFSRAPPTEEPIQRSDYLRLSGQLRAGFGNFVGSISQPTILQVMRPEPGDWFLNLRNQFAKQIRTFIPAPESGLELGYLLGMKAEVDPEIEETLRIVGLTHIVVASGTHLGIIVGFCRKLFGKFSRLASLIFATFCTLVFVGITGLTPSMLRAAFVSELMLIAWYFGRDAPAWRVLLLAAAFTLVVDPQNLVNLAWQLSFGSFAGLMLLSPIITRFFYGDKTPGFIGTSLITSISTMLCCAPILLYSFGSISLLSFVANPLILPTIPIVMLAGCLTGLFGLCNVAFLATLAGGVADAILKYHLAVVGFLSEQVSFIIQLPKNNSWVFLLWLIPLIILGVSITLARRHQRLVVLAYDAFWLPNLSSAEKSDHGDEAVDSSLSSPISEHAQKDTSS